MALPDTTCFHHEAKLVLLTTPNKCRNRERRQPKYFSHSSTSIWQETCCVWRVLVVWRGFYGFESIFNKVGVLETRNHGKVVIPLSASEFSKRICGHRVRIIGAVLPVAFLTSSGGSWPCTWTTPVFVQFTYKSAHKFL